MSSKSNIGATYRSGIRTGARLLKEEQRAPVTVTLGPAYKPDLDRDAIHGTVTKRGRAAEIDEHIAAQTAVIHHLEETGQLSPRRGRR